MKKSLVALATLSFIGGALADVDVSGGVKLYGVLDQSIQTQSLTDASTGTATNQTGLFASAATSRFGVKASRDLSDGFKGIAQAEIQLDPDTATLLPNKNRTAFVGLQSEAAGSLLLGTMETTAYEVFGMDVNGRVEYKPQVWRTTASSDTQDRANNSVKYITPEFGGLTGHIMVSYAENPDTSTGSDFKSVGIKYNKDKLKFAILNDSLTNSKGSYRFAGIANAGVSKDYITANAGTQSKALVYAGSSTSTLYRDIASVSYDFGVFAANYIYAKSYASASNAGNLTTGTIGIRVPMDKFTFAISYGAGKVDSYQSADTSGSANNTKAGDGSITDRTIGIYYNFDKSTQVYFLGSNSSSTGVGYADGINQTTAFGVRYNF